MLKPQPPKFAPRPFIRRGVSRCRTESPPGLKQKQNVKKLAYNCRNYHFCNVNQKQKTMRTTNKANEARKKAAINKLWNFRHHGVKSFKQLIDAGVFKAAKIEMVPELKYNRAKYNRFTDRQAQEEYYRRCTEKTKKAYFLYYDEKTSTEVSKYVFEYFNETRPAEPADELPEATEEDLKHLFGLH